MSEHHREQPQQNAVPAPRSAETESDAEILSRHLAGDRHAFTELIRRHGPYLRSVASRIVGRLDAEDVVQDAFLNALRSAHRFEGRAAVRTWLHRITVNEAVNHVRHRAARGFENPLDDCEEPRSPDAELDTIVVGQDLVSELLGAVPTSTRRMIVLVDLLGYSTAEAARALGVAEGTVKSRRSRAFDRLALRVQR